MMATAKPKTTNKGDRKAESQATDAGIDAAKAGAEETTCPHGPGILREAWIGGFHAETKRMASPDTDATPDQTAKTGGHKFDDPDVKKHEESLKTVLRDLDDVGVVMSEEQFRTLDNDERAVATRWANGRKMKVLSPVPVMLQSFVKNKSLLKEIGIYQDDQVEARRETFPVRFGRPSPTKPEGDPEQMIRMALFIPVQFMNYASAGILWHWKRCRIEFGKRDVHSWDQKEFGECSNTIFCVADIAGFTLNRTHYKVSFLIGHEQLSSTEAMKLWQSNGSARMEPIGLPDSKDADDHNPENEKKETEPAEVSRPQRSLLDIVKQSAKAIDKETVFITPDEFLVPIPSIKKGAAAWISIGLGSNNRFYAGHLLTFDLDKEIVECETVCEFKGDGLATLQEAIKSELGSMIDEALKAGAPESLLNDCRDHLKHLEKGGAPIPMPE